MKLAVGQRWLRINYGIKYTIEILEVISANTAKCAIVQSNDHTNNYRFQVGYVINWASVSENGWRYLHGQDRPNE